MLVNPVSKPFNSRPDRLGAITTCSGVCGNAGSFNLHINAGKHFQRLRRAFFGPNHEQNKKKKKKDRKVVENL